MNYALLRVAWDRSFTEIMNPIFFQDPTETGEAATEQVVQTEEAVADNHSDHQDVTDNLDDQQNQVTTLLSAICNSFV